MKAGYCRQNHTEAKNCGHRAQADMNDKPSLDTRLAWIPALSWIRTYAAQNVRVDLIAGLSPAAFVIPESLAYALFGTSRQLAVGPTSSLAIVLATSVVSMANGDVSLAIALVGAVALMVG